MRGKMFDVAERGPFRVVAPRGGSDYVGEHASRKAIRAVLSVYGYLAGSSLGSRGAYKLVHGRYGDVVPTRKLYLVLEEASKENPVVQAVWEAARRQWRLYGDGVKTVVLLAYQLYSEGARLVEEHGLRPSTVVEGFTRAYRIHAGTLEELAERTGPIDCPAAARSLAAGSQEPEVLAGLLCGALERYRARPCRARLSEAVAVERVEGGSVYDSSLVEGVVARKRIMQYNAPKHARGPLRVAVVDQKLYVDYRGEGIRFTTSDPGVALELARAASEAVKPLASRLLELGVDLLVNVKGVDPAVEQWLHRHGVIVVRRVDAERARLLALASGARMASSIRDLREEDIGVVDSVEEVNLGGRYYTIFKAGKGCASTILLRGPWFTVDSMHEEVRMALRGLEAYLADPRGVPGGGAPEVEAAERIREAARRAGGKEGLAMEAYADAIEVIPRTLARHAGLNPLDAVAELRSLHARGHWAAGVDEGRLEVAEDTRARRVVDLYTVRASAVAAGVALAVSLLRVSGIAVHRRGAELRRIREG
ncbi:TCP-1/cpn60 chaperonin family protein [Stetteria hydrogenophila]